MAKRNTKTTRPRAGLTGPQRPRPPGLAVAPAAGGRRISSEIPAVSLWPDAAAPPDGVARRAPTATARTLPQPAGRMPLGTVPATGRRPGSRVPPSQIPYSLEEEMAFIRGDIRRMLVVSGIIFLLLIGLGLVLT